jgi:hypothetical protein
VLEDTLRPCWQGRRAEVGKSHLVF